MNNTNTENLLPHRPSREGALDILSDRKEKLSPGERRAFRRAMGKPVLVSYTEPKNGSVRFTEWSSRRSLNQLLRERTKATRRDSTARHLLEKLHPTSKFAPALREQILEQQARIVIVNEIIKYRTTNHEQQ